MKTIRIVKPVRNVVFIIVLQGVAGCALQRNPVSLAGISDGCLAGLSKVRYWEV